MLAALRILILLAETYCETLGFRGTCCRVANWIHLGQTQGSGKLDTCHKYNQPAENVFVKSPGPDWQQIPNR